MKYIVKCRIDIRDTYEIEAKSEDEAKDIAYDSFVRDYGLDNNLCILGFGLSQDVEEIENEG